MRRLKNTIEDQCRWAYVLVLRNSERLSLLALFIFGVVLLIGGLAKLAHAVNPADLVGDLANGNKVAEQVLNQAANQLLGTAGGTALSTTAEPTIEVRDIRCGTGFLFQILHGSLGALMLILTMISTLIAAWFQKYEVAFGVLILIAGVLIIQPMTEIMFEVDYASVPDLLPLDAVCY